MKNFKKILLAGVALGLGLSSATSFSRPSCQDMCDMCNEGNMMWCNIVRSDGGCDYGMSYGCN